MGERPRTYAEQLKDDEQRRAAITDWWASMAIREVIAQKRAAP
jgi:hypothetical protein